MHAEYCETFSKENLYLITKLKLYSNTLCFLSIMLKCLVFLSIMLKISFISTNYIILFELKEYLCINLVFSCRMFIFATKTCRSFSFNKDENWFVALIKDANLKTKLLARNDHVIDIFTSEDMENISLCIFSMLLSTSTI